MEKCRLVNRFSVRYALSVTCINVMPLHSEFETTVLPSSSSYWLPLQTFQRSRKKENLIHGAILSMICCFNVKVASVLKMNTKGCWKVAERLNMATLPAPLLTTLYYKPCFSETVWELERKEKRKRQGKKGGEERKKNNGCTLSFYNGRFGDSFWRKKKAVGHKGPICWWRFQKSGYILCLYIFFCQVLMVSSHKPEDWITNCTNALKKASTLFSSSGSVNAFSLFESAPYCAKRMGDDGSEDDKLQDMDRIKNNDLIFKDHSGCLETIPKVS